MPPKTPKSDSSKEKTTPAGTRKQATLFNFFKSPAGTVTSTLPVREEKPKLEKKASSSQLAEEPEQTLPEPVKKTPLSKGILKERPILSSDAIEPPSSPIARLKVPKVTFSSPAPSASTPSGRGRGRRNVTYAESSDEENGDPGSQRCKDPSKPAKGSANRLLSAQKA